MGNVCFFNRRPLSVWSAVLGILLLVAAADVADAQTTGIAGDTVGPIPIVMEQAEQVRWDAESRRLVATGEVRARYGNRTMRADTVIYSDTSGWLYARGNARGFSPLGQTIRGKAIAFHPTTNEIRVNGAEIEMASWFLQAGSMEGFADTEIVVTNGSFSTCHLSTPHYDIMARTIYIYPGDRIVAYHAFPRIHEYPVFYLPYLSIDLNTDLSRWDFEPGHQKRDGALLGVTYHYSLPRDNNPYTGSIYTDLRQKVNPGIGADFDYNGELGNFYLFHFNTYREPLEIDNDGDRSRADNKEYMYRLRSGGDLNFGESNWRLQGNLDWQGDDRIENTEFRNLALSRSSRRKIDGALTHRGDVGLLTIQAQEDERIVSDPGGESFRRNQSRLPSIRYNMFSYPIPGYAGGPWNVRFSASSTRQSNGEQSPYLWLSNARTSISKTLPLFRGYSQKWRLGYRQQYNELAGDTGSDFQSIGSSVFSLENTFIPADPLSFKLQYDFEKRLNKKDQVNLQLNRDSFGQEEDGFRKHALRFNASWSGDQFYTFFRTGYDLRNSEQFNIESDSRVISPLLNVTGQLTPTLAWSQFFRYDWARSQLDQANTRFGLEPATNLKTAIGWNFNRGTSRDFSELYHQFLWDFPDPGWRFRSDLVYDLETDELDETRLSLYKRMHLWDLWINFRDIRNGGAEVTFNINLSDRPPAQGSLSEQMPRQERFLDEGFGR